jgi:hypothetical protein
MSGGLYYNGLKILWATLSGQRIDILNDTIYIALLGNNYVLDQANHLTWDDISSYDIGTTGTYSAGGTQITPVAPYIDDTTYAPFVFLVATANAAATPAYSISWQAMTFTGLLNAAVFKKGGTAATSPLISCLDVRKPDPDNPGSFIPQTASGDKFYVDFQPLGFANLQVFKAGA